MSNTTERHECIQCQVIEEMRKTQHDMDKTLAVAQSDISTVKGDIKDINSAISKFNWWFIGIMATTILTLVTLLYKG